MGRAFQVRAASMAASASKKSTLYMRASKEIYMAAKSGLPDPIENLTLRSAIEKWRAQDVTRDVIERAIKKASGGAVEAYVTGRYEAFGPGNSYIIVDSLTDNVNRALTEIRTAITRRGGHMGTVSFNFLEIGLIVFKGKKKDEVEEALILGDVDVSEVSEHDGVVEVQVAPSALNNAKTVLSGLGVTSFEVCEITMIPNETITLKGEDLVLFKSILDVFDELQDVQSFYHNVIL